MSENIDVQLVVKISYSDYQLAMKILQSYQNKLEKNRKRAIELKGSIDENRLRVKNFPKFTIIEPLSYPNT